MRSHELPEWVIDVLSRIEAEDDDPFYLLAGYGRNVAFVRMAAGEVFTLSRADQRIIEYHAYVGISACRSALDSLATWVGHVLKVDCHRTQVTWSNPAFRKAVLRQLPVVRGESDQLSALSDEIGEWRNRAQHREGSAIAHDAQGAWVLTKGLQSHGYAEPLADTLTRWIDSIDIAAEIIAVAVCIEARI